MHKSECFLQKITTSVKKRLSYFQISLFFLHFTKDSFHYKITTSEKNTLSQSSLFPKPL